MEKHYEVLNELIPKTQELHRAIFDKGYEQGKQDALAQIRAEIEGKYRVILKSTPPDDWARRGNECVDEILEVIDKYKEADRNTDTDGA